MTLAEKAATQAVRTATSTLARGLLGALLGRRR
jgi:hypothetical protein